MWDGGGVKEEEEEMVEGKGRWCMWELVGEEEVG